MSLTVAIYARYSAEIQNLTSIDDQIALCRNYAEAQGWTVTHVYADAAMSGRTANRPEFIRMQQAAAAKSFDVVLVEAVNRVSRRVVDNLQTWELFALAGVKLYSVNEGDQDFLRVLLNGLGAQMHSEKIAEHTRRGHVGALQREGRIHSVPYGYRKVEGQSGVREIDPETAPIVQRIFRDAAEGKSGDEIARGLNADGVPSPKGGIWYGSTIRGGSKIDSGILRRTLYVGTVTYGRTANRLHPETGMRRIAATPDRRVTRDVPELRIVSQKLWDRVQAQLAHSAQAVAASPTQNARAAHRKTKLFSGLMTCGCCGRDYIVMGNKRYGCTGYRAGACSNGRSIRQDRIEARVFDKLRCWFLIPELTAAFDKAAAEEAAHLEKGGGKDKVKSLRRKLKKLNGERNRLLKVIMAGTAFESISEAFAGKEAEIAAVKADLAAAEEAIAERDTPPPHPAEAYARSVAQLEKRLSDPELVHQAHEHLTILIEKIVLRPDELAEDGIAAEIHTGLGRFYCAGSPRATPHLPPVAPVVERRPSAIAPPTASQETGDLSDADRLPNALRGLTALMAKAHVRQRATRGE